MMNRKKNTFLVLLVNGVVLLVGLILLELSFGGWLRPNKMNRLNLLQNYSRLHDASSLYSTTNGLIRYTRDQYGLRGTFSSPSEINILTVGGSTTDQRFIGDGQTWQDHLQACMRDGGLDAVIANAGVDGQSSYGHIKNFTWWFPLIPEFRPGIIIYYVGINDFFIETYSYDNIEGDQKNQSIRSLVSNNSALWNVVRNLRGAYKAMVVERIYHQAVDFNAVKWISRPLQKDYAFMEPRLKQYAERLRRLIELTHEHDAVPILVTQPLRKYRVTENIVEGDSTESIYDGFSYNGVDYCHMMKKLDNVTRKIAAETGSYLVDISDYPGWDDADFYDFAHMTPSGAAKVGRLLCDALMAPDSPIHGHLSVIEQGEKP